jgi:hypothetical protein
MPSDDKKPPAGQAQPSAAAPSSQPSGEDDSLEATAGQPSTAAPADPAPPPKPGGVKGKIPFLNNKYLIVFVLVLLMAGSVVYISLKAAKPSTTTTKFGSLTSQQLSSLKGNTTLVGDSKQTLDVQSNSIFEGQVLLRSDLNVAGALKVGSGLSIPSLTAGPGTFSQLGISGGLNVAGDTSLQGNLTVQKNLSVGGNASFNNLSISTLSVTTLGLKGDLSLNQHINTSGGVPSRSNGTALGSGGTASVSGSDTAGTIAINTGGGPPAGCFLTVNFSQKFNNTPHIVISPSNSNAASLQYYTTNRSASGFSICTNTAPAAATGYNFDYIAIN